MQPGKLRGIRRLADERGVFKMLAVDQRPPVHDLIADRRGVDDAPHDDVVALKRALIEELAPLASAVLVDPLAAFASSDRVDARQGLLLTLEDHAFDETELGRRSNWISGWSVDQIKRTGADGVKLLLWYRPDADTAVRRHQLDVAERTGDACRRYDIPFILELLTYPMPGAAEPAGPIRGAQRIEHVLESVEVFAPERYGVDIFKVESPVLPADLVPIERASDPERSAFRDLDASIGRPWVLLSGGSTREAFLHALRYAFAAGASGFLAGRSIWWQAAAEFPDWDAVRAGLRDDAAPYMRTVDELADSRAVPWWQKLSATDAALLGGRTDEFPACYAPMHPSTPDRGSAGRDGPAT